ncbi:ABC transporter permease [Anthocerotibacter panamensis]|uniref:ABC transporter permease n=1 Tax=Anthocerotibacter panamensis TaxID=2857077 RepID=UPI001C40252D|nr:ABC transporter permease [Anthocerotibacter panamensis]
MAQQTIPLFLQPVTTTPNRAPTYVMDLGETIGLAWASLLANKLRSMLTMLGVIIGTAAVIALVAIGRGAQAQAEQQFKSLGSNLIFVRNGVARGSGPVSQGLGSASTLTLEDADAIAHTAAAVEAVAPQLNARAQVTFGGANTNTSIVGTTPSYVSVRDFLPLTGRFFNQVEVNQQTRVAVLGQTTVKSLGLDAQTALGKTIRIRGDDFRVIGTLEYKGANQFQDQDDQVVIPLTTMARRIVGVNSLKGIALSSIAVSAKSATQMDAAQFQLTNLLKLRHGEEDFNMRSQADLVDAASTSSAIFTTLLGWSAAISLLVGGIGIMNIMLVSVTERTREIGVRKAIGARSKDILWQFLVEAIVLSVTGGVLGVLLGIGTTLLIRISLGWETIISPESMVLAFAVSFAVGAFFGVYPARRAAGLDPITALRTD